MVHTVRYIQLQMVRLAIIIRKLRICRKLVSGGVDQKFALLGCFTASYVHNQPFRKIGGGLRKVATFS